MNTGPLNVIKKKPNIKELMNTGPLNVIMLSVVKQTVTMQSVIAPIVFSNKL